MVGKRHMAKGTEELRPITESPTPRQQFQRAFATEFLCPIKSLKDFVGNRPPDDDFLAEAASKHWVSPLLIERALINNGLLQKSAWSS